MNTLGRFNAAFVEACRVARLRRWPERLGQDALRLERGDFYGWLAIANQSSRVANALERDDVISLEPRACLRLMRAPADAPRMHGVAMAPLAIMPHLHRALACSAQEKRRIGLQ